MRASIIIIVLVLVVSASSLALKMGVPLSIGTTDLKDVLDWYQVQRGLFPSITPEVGPVLSATITKDWNGYTYEILFDVKGAADGFVGKRKARIVR